MRITFAALPIILLAVTGSAQPAQTDTLRQVQAIPLANVQGRIDHMSADIQGRRLFVSALGNNSLEVLDLRAGKRLTSIMGLREPQGVFFVPNANKIFVANGDDGTCRIFDGSSYKLLSIVRFASDADNVRYDVAANQIYIGYGAGALGVLDARTNAKISDIALPAHPESFRLELGGPKIFVNLPDHRHTISVLDRARRSLIATWQMDAAENFPMALVEAQSRLFVATRRPPRLLVLDSKSGKQIADYPAVGDADDLFYDSARRRVYISGGEGFIGVFGQTDHGDQYELISRISTAIGARTSLFVPELNRLYLAVPRRASHPAEIRVYEPLP